MYIYMYNIIYIFIYIYILEDKFHQAGVEEIGFVVDFRRGFWLIFGGYFWEYFSSIFGRLLDLFFATFSQQRLMRSGLGF
jgi:hypothetical protein